MCSQEIIILQAEKPVTIEFLHVSTEIAQGDYRHDTSQHILTENEARQLAAWNATECNYDREKCLPELIAIQAATTPDAIALVYGDAVLSYRELNEQANRLAHYLLSLGVKPGMLVGLCVERSFDMVVGLLGILKAGGAYLPLDPAYPLERLAFMLEDARAPVLLTHGTASDALIERLPESVAALVRLDADARAIAGEPARAPAVTLDPQHPAYVIYTSGSTGAPKGV